MIVWLIWITAVYIAAGAVIVIHEIHLRSQERSVGLRK